MGMNVSLTTELERFVSEKLAEGTYASRSEVVRAGLRLLIERERLIGAQVNPDRAGARAAGSDLTDMARSTDRLERLERRHARSLSARRSFADALRIFEGLWAEASALREDFPEDWRRDIQADLTLARVLNGIAARS